MLIELKTAEKQMNHSKNAQKMIDLGLKALQIELEAVRQLANQIDGAFATACDYFLACQGRVIVMGIGKSGHIGRKIAATFASTGTPAFFVHPAEASHGDLGMITKNDVVLAISHSGESEEILTLLPLIKRLGTPLIALTGRPNSTLAREATVNLNVQVPKEACPFNLAPTASTTATLVMGDALAIALLESRGFTREDFARSHPGGQLGRRLLIHVSDIMHTGDAIPKVTEDVSLSKALLEMTNKALGMTGIVNEANQVVGIFTDGDLRRALDRELNIHTTTIGDVMTRGCLTTTADLLAAETLNIMETKKINSFLVVNENNELIGAFNFLDLLRAGVT